jgi:hypothetical protein
MSWMATELAWIWAGASPKQRAIQEYEIGKPDDIINTKLGMAYHRYPSFP